MLLIQNCFFSTSQQMRCELQCTKEALSQAWKADLPVLIVFLTQSFFPVLLWPKCVCLLVWAVFLKKVQLSEFSPQKREPRWRSQSALAFLRGVSCSPVGFLVSHWKMGGKENLLWGMPCSHLFLAYCCGFVSLCATRTMCRGSATGSHPSTISGSRCIYLVAEIYIG